MHKYKIMLSEVSYFCDVMNIMKEKWGWLVMYAVEGDVNSVQANKLKDFFPGVLMHGMTHAILGLAHNEILSSPYEPLDKLILDEFSDSEARSLKMMDRISGGSVDSFSYFERVRLYHRLLSFYLKLFDDIKPDLVMFPSVPHMNYDFIMYEVCKKRNIRTFILEKTPIQDLIYGIERYEDGLTEAKLDYDRNIDNALEKIDLWPESKIYLNSLLEGYDKGKPIHTKYKEENIINDTVFSRMKKRVNIIKSAVFSDSFCGAEVLRGEIPELQCKDRSRIKYIFSFISRSKFRRSLKRYYDRLVYDVDLTSKYIFVALQCQPEKSTSPMGDIFVHQYLFIKMLSACIDEKWKIYVKEHPMKFVKRIDKSKTQSFYDEIVSIKNVELVPLHKNTFDLIDNSKAVAVITGSVGFEALYRKKPVLVFGHTWYSGCDGSYDVQSMGQLEKAIQKIESGVVPNRDKIDFFISILQKYSIRGSTHSAYQRLSNISNLEMVTSIVKDLERKFS